MGTASLGKVLTDGPGISAYLNTYENRKISTNENIDQRNMDRLFNTYWITERWLKTQENAILMKRINCFPCF